LSQGNRSLTGVFLGAELEQGERAYRMIAQRLEDVAKGELQVVIDSRFPLKEAEAAHEHIENRAAFGRVLLIPE